MIGKILGEIFTALSFSGALVAMISYLLAEQREGLEKRSWERMGLAGFGAHIVSVLGIIITMFTLIYLHKYEYYYVWAHSSNELPVYYIISCFWEGQEGSFLLWSFWHCILGGLFLFSKSEWRNSVLAIVASIEVILSSMLLGVYANDSWVTGIYLLMVIAPAIYLGLRFFQDRNALVMKGNFHLASLFVAGMFLVLLFRGQMGYDLSRMPGMFESGGLSSLGFRLMLLFMLGYGVLYLMYISRIPRTESGRVWETVAGAALLGMGLFAVLYEPTQWKLGSTPFLTLKDVFPNDEVFKTDPDFIPTNGNGLNPLLQNYWMVIHPPTLFLGFASATIPFAFVMAGLIRGKYTEWIKPALPWVSFSVMVLGIGIIMGGYWAYETLNFGGYWNWDPVENGSLVPWLTGVASLHGLLIFQRSKTYLKLTMIMIISTFLLVLYSTFLTRSGILGDTSVHTFTDLGLSGQLIILVAVYFVFVLVTMIYRWRDIPFKEDQFKVWTPEFMLFLGILTFIFSAGLIILSTSLPVFNSIFGTNLAMPAYIQLFYYKINVWFAIAFGVLSGLGQFLWWKMGRNKSVGDALFRPFVAAVVAGGAVIVALMFSKWEFVYDIEYAKIIDTAETGHTGLTVVIDYIRFGIISIADELMLFSSLFAFFANLDVLFALITRNRKGLKVMGGTVVHIGFALMLLGILFSSGYDRIISKNLFPESMANLPERERVDNVQIPRFQTTPIEGYNVVYKGKRQPKSPISDVKILEENFLRFKVAFDDATGERFALELPRGFFLKKESLDQLSPQKTTNELDFTQELIGEIDIELVTQKLNENIEDAGAELINSRTQYELEFIAQDDPDDRFTIFPETELNSDEGFTTHPNRRIYLGRDIYVFVSGFPKEEAVEPQLFDINLRIGDTARIGQVVIQLGQVRNMTGTEGLEEYDIAAGADLKVYAGDQVFEANPVYVLKDRSPGMLTDGIPEIGMEFALVSIDPASNTMAFQVRAKDPTADYVLIKAISKPLINFLWLGTFVLTAGFLISIYRRRQEVKASRAKA